MLTPNKRALILECKTEALAIVKEARRTRVWWIGVAALSIPPFYRFTLDGPFRKGAAIHHRHSHTNAQTVKRLLDTVATRKGAPFTRKDMDLYLAEVEASS